MHLLRLRPPRPRRLAFHRVPRRVVLAPVSVDTIDLALHTVLAQAAAAGLSRQEARACVVELGQLARMPESAPAPRAWRGGGLPKLCAPSEGLLGDVIVNASEIVQPPEKFHLVSLQRRGHFFLLARIHRPAPASGRFRGAARSPCQI